MIKFLISEDHRTIQIEVSMQGSEEMEVGAAKQLTAEAKSRLVAKFESAKLKSK